MRIRKTKNNKNKIRTIIIKHINNNKKEYIIISIIFVIGIFLAVLFINKTNEEIKKEISNFLDNGINEIKQAEKINYIDIFKTSLLKNMTITFILWFLGTTIVGIPLVFGIIIYEGFSLGYTISSLVLTLGNTKGIVFTLVALLFQNILAIPAILAIGVSCLKLYKSITQNRRKENIKIEIARHTFFSLTMLLVLAISSVIETFITTNGLLLIAKYF